MKNLFLLALVCSVGKSFGQTTIYSDKFLRKELNQTIDFIYGLKFEKSESQIIKLESMLGDHPAVELIRAFEIYWEKKPFKIGSRDYTLFEGYLLKSLQLSQGLLKQNENNVEAKFFALAAHAYLAQLYVDNDEKLKALGEAKSCYEYIIEGFDLLDQYPEYYFPCGIYDYYREKYPEENPFFKPFLWFFRSGDKAEGLDMLKKGAEKSIFTKVENLNYLFHIYLRYEMKPEKALPYAEKLYRMYPANMTFVSHYAEALLNTNRFSASKPLIDSMKTDDSKYNNYIGFIFEGIYQEKFLSQPDAAIKTFDDADSLGNVLEMRNPHMDSYLYCGLGRAYLKKGDRKKAEMYFNKAYKVAEYNLVKKEAQRYLESL